MEVFLKNADQSGTYDPHDLCRDYYEDDDDKCLAKYAIDRDLTTCSYIGDRIGWWKAEMERAARIESILFYLLTDNKGYYSKMTVETKMHDNDKWTACIGEVATEGSVKPFEVKCNQAVTAKYIQISTARKEGLAICEVKVFLATGKIN